MLNNLVFIAGADNENDVDGTENCPPAPVPLLSLPSSLPAWTRRRRKSR